LQSAEELARRAAYPEAVESYRMALEALAQLPDAEASSHYDILRSMSLAAEQAGDWDEALCRLSDALSFASGDPEREAETYASIGWLCFQRGEIQDALEALDHGADLYVSLQDRQGVAQVDYYRGMVYGHQKEWRRALQCLERYTSTSEELGLDGRAAAYTELGNLYRLQHDWEAAEAYLQQGIELARVERDYAVLAQGYNYLGSCYALQGQSRAVDMLQRALDIVHTRTKQPVQEARIRNTLAETLVRLNRWEEAEDAFRASAAIKERLGDRVGLAMTYGGLGRLYFRQWHFDQAIEYLQRDIDLLTDEFDANLAWIQQWTNLIGEAHRLQGRYERAGSCFAEALSLAKRIPDRDVREQSVAFTHLLMARLALDEDDLRLAEVERNLAWDALVDTWAEGEVQRTAARLARARGDLGRATQHLERALGAADRGEDLDRALSWLEAAYISRDVGDLEQARAWIEEVLQAARRLRNDELARRAGHLLATL
jgi:tetratricopeptide (TPR) repeat protein